MKTFYYTDELHDDFAGTDINTQKIRGDYQYLSTNPVRKAFAWFLHHIIATPLVFLYNQIGHGERIVGREKLKPYRKTGYFLYGNHTRSAGDSYEPSLLSFPRKAYIIAGPDAVSIPGVRRIVQDLGVIPLPSDTASARHFHDALQEHFKGVDITLPDQTLAQAIKNVENKHKKTVGMLFAHLKGLIRGSIEEQKSKFFMIFYCCSFYRQQKISCR